MKKRQAEDSQLLKAIYSEQYKQEQGIQLQSAISGAGDRMHIVTICLSRVMRGQYSTLGIRCYLYVSNNIYQLW